MPRIIDPDDKPTPDPWHWDQMTEDFYKLKKLDEEFFRRYQFEGGYANIGPWMFGTKMGKKCDRFLGYYAIGAIGESTITATLRRIFEVGTWAHFRLQTRIQIMFGDDVEIEPKKFMAGLQLASKCDGILRGKHGLEIKTISPKGFRKVLSRHAPLPDHLDQAYLTMAIFGLEDDTFIYVNKQVNDRGYYDELPITIPFNQLRFNKLAKRIKGRVLGPISRGETPIPNRGSHCKECPFRAACKINSFGD